MTGGRRCISPSSASPLDNVDILFEILLRLPPAPSSLPRASGVCKLWRRLVSDPAFLRCFHARHRRNPPLLGFFSEGLGGISFTPALEPPDRVPPEYFSLQLDDTLRSIICCRHGLILFENMRSEFLVWDPVTGDQHHIVVPAECRFNKKDLLILHGFVLRDDIGGGPSNNFRVLLVGVDFLRFTRTYARVYSSDTGTWGNLISTASPSMNPMHVPSVMVGGSLYWLLEGNSPGIRVLELIWIGSA
ncbi:hypothetical protein QOZ80_2BG0161560 [Eleusine coracana subsp. coracana]|nr:hypothetical protein QOZ80_2BG0161560 [Eleusine coracana subsp. coracana]